MKTGDKVIFTNKIGQEKKAIVINIVQNGKLLLEIEGEENKTYVTTEKHCEKICEMCEGTGKTFIPAYQQGGEIVEEKEETCTLCNGTGKEIHI